MPPGLRRQVSPGHLHWHSPQHLHCLTTTADAHLWLDTGRLNADSPACHTQPKDAPLLAAPRSASITDASTHFPLTEFFLACIFFQRPLASHDPSCLCPYRNSTKIIAATCGRFHAVIVQEASDHVPHVSDQFIAYTGDTDLAILLDRGAFEPNPAVFAFSRSFIQQGHVACGPWTFKTLLSPAPPLSRSAGQR